METLYLQELCLQERTNCFATALGKVSESSWKHRASRKHGIPGGNLGKAPGMRNPLMPHFLDALCSQEDLLHVPPLATTLA